MTPFRAQVGRIEQIRNRFDDQVEFFVVYVQEAHPTDDRQSDSNVTEGVLFRQHQSFDEREEVAQTCNLDLHTLCPSSSKRWIT